MTPQPSIHASLANGRWHTLTLAEQLGNIGSDVERAFRAHAQERSDRFVLAFDRALELFDLTAADQRLSAPGRREILRAREQFCRVFFDDTCETDLTDYLRKYFLQFAVAARRETGFHSSAPRSSP